MISGWLAAKSQSGFLLGKRPMAIIDDRDGRPLADDESATAQVLLQDAQEVVEPLAKERPARSDQGKA